MSHLYWRNDEPQQAIAYWVAAYRIAKEIGLSDALMHLEKLAKQLGGSGLEYWEQLSQRIGASGLE